MYISWDMPADSNTFITKTDQELQRWNKSVSSKEIAIALISNKSKETK